MSKKIIVVDNNPVMIKFMGNYLGKKGHEVKTALNGLEALEIMENFLPDVMFIDLIMPNITGDMLCRIIRSRPEYENIVIAVLSAAIVEDSEDYATYGADVFIAKGPFNKISEHVDYVISLVDNDTRAEGEPLVRGIDEIYKREITKELLNTGKHFETVIKCMTEGVLEITLKGIVVFANPSAVRIIGLGQEEILARKLLDFFEGQDRERVDSVLSSLQVAPAYMHEDDPVTLNGVSLRIDFIPMGNTVKGSIAVILKDVTKDRAAKEALAQSERQYRQTLDALKESIHVINSDYQVIQVNRALLEFNKLLHLETDIIGMDLFDIYPFLGSGDHEKYKKAFEVGHEIISEETMILGEQAVITKTRLIPILDDPITDDAKVARVVTITKDITEKKSYEKAIKASEDQMRSIIESSPIGVRIASASKFVYVNPAFLKIFEYESAESVVGHSVSDFHVKEDRSRIIKRHLDILSGKEVPMSYESKCIRKNGEVFDVQIWLTETIYKGEPGVLGFVVDISSEKDLASRMLQMQKMEAITALAGGIAHKFNNALGGMMGNLELLKLKIENSPLKANKYIDRLFTSSEQMVQLTNHLLAYARKGKYHPENVSMTQFVRDTLPLIKHKIPKGVDIEMNLASGLPFVECDVMQMQMAFSAVINNAGEAIAYDADDDKYKEKREDSGRIKISTKLVKIKGSKESSSQRSALPDGEYILLEVSDNGRGLDEESKNKIFEPFYTTKMKGGGLGMPALLGIIKNHMGEIELDSEIGAGTTVRIYLPAKEIPVVTMEAAPKNDVETFQKTVLLVDDEKSVLEVTKIMLEMIGMKVLEASTGEDALEQASKNKDIICMAIVDITLPDMDGGDVFNQLKLISPDMEILYVSGYNFEDVSMKININSTHFLQKPFSYTQLSEKITGIINE